MDVKKTVSGKIVRSGMGILFWVLCLIMATVTAVYFGRDSVYLIQEGTVWEAALSLGFTFVWILAGLWALMKIIGTKGASLELNDGVLTAEWGMFSNIRVNSEHISGMTLRGRSLLIIANGKKYKLPAIYNAGDLYRALRRWGVPGRLYMKLSDEELAVRCRHSKITKVISIVISILVTALLVFNIYVLPYLGNEGLAEGGLLLDDAEIQITIVSIIVLSVLSVFHFAVILKKREKSEDAIDEQTARVAIKVRDTMPPAYNYGEIVKMCRMYDERFRLYIFKPERGNGYSFSVEVYILKTGKWRTVYDFSDRFRFDSVVAAVAAASKLTQLDVDYETGNEEQE